MCLGAWWRPDGALGHVPGNVGCPGYRVTLMSWVMRDGVGVIRWCIHNCDGILI